MKNIVIKHSMRDNEPNLGNIPKDHIFIDLDKELNAKYIKTSNLTDKTLKMTNVYPIILKILITNDIKHNEEFTLYCVAPNSVLVGISYYLTLAGYNFNFLPKPTNEENWGYRDNTKTKNKVPTYMQPIIKGATYKSKMEDEKEACIILNGAYDVSPDNMVRIGNATLCTSNKYTGEHEKKLNVIFKFGFQNEGFSTLVTQESFEYLQKEIVKMFDKVNEYGIEKLHILNSIPANGLLLLGRWMALHKLREKVTFFLYNFYVNDEYEIGDIISYEQFKQLEDGVTNE